MKLYERDTEVCVLLKKVSAGDGEGGYTDSVSEGAVFRAALIPEGTREFRIGGKERRLVKYSAAIPLEYGIRLSPGDVFRTESGREFIVTEKSEVPPETSVIRFTKVSAEAWTGDDSV